MCSPQRPDGAPPHCRSGLAPAVLPLLEPAPHREQPDRDPGVAAVTPPRPAPGNAVPHESPSQAKRRTRSQRPPGGCRSEDEAVPFAPAPSGNPPPHGGRSEPDWQNTSSSLRRSAWTSRRRSTWLPAASSKGWETSEHLLATQRILARPAPRCTPKRPRKIEKETLRQRITDCKISRGSRLRVRMSQIWIRNGSRNGRNETSQRNQAASAAAASAASARAEVRQRRSCRLQEPLAVRGRH